MTPLVELDQVSITNLKGKAIVADMSIAMLPNEVLALTGESGSGKSTTALSILGLLPESLTVAQGRVTVANVDMQSASRDALRKIRGGTLGWIPQDPISSLNPVMKVGRQLQDVLRLSWTLATSQLTAMAYALLRDVQLDDVERISAAYPHQLSGGQAQRVCIARAIARKPQGLIADEPTTALDARTRREILRLLLDLRSAKGMSMLFITHDIGAIHDIADRVGVMYAGRLVELTSKRDFFASPLHPYTFALLSSASSVMDLDRQVGPVDANSAVVDRTTGCSLAPRCPHATSICRSNAPALKSIAPGRQVACHHSDTWRQRIA